MLIGISIVLLVALFFNIKFNAGVDTLLLGDNHLLYYKVNNQPDLSRLTLDFSNISAKVQRFTLLKEDTICKESVIRSDEDINNYEIEMDRLSAGKYTVKITTDDNMDLSEEIMIGA